MALSGGFAPPNDETGDCHQFTHATGRASARLGVKFRQGVAVKSLQQSHGRISAVELEGGETGKTDHYVLAAGSYSARGLLTFGPGHSVYPVKGYSLTIPLLDPSLAPQSTVLDETHKDCTHAPG